VENIIHIIIFMKIKFLFTLIFIALMSLVYCKNPVGPSRPDQPDQGDQKGYKYYSLGNPTDVSTPFSPGLVLMGGGQDVDAAFQWLINKSGGGDIVVIRASGTDAYNPYIFNLGHVDSVETLIVDTKTGADDPFVADKIRKAEALFIAGGDQAQYISLWQGTALQASLQELIQRGVPMGGTSAGLAVLGEYVFSALRGTVYSNEALANPYDHRVTLKRNFLSHPLLMGIITDSHFVSRDRMGRLIVFLARIIKDGWAGTAKGIGIDERTALLVENNGTVSLTGTGTAYFLMVDHEPEVCTAGAPLTFSRIQVHKLELNGLFNILQWQGTTSPYFISVTNGIVSSSTGSIY